MDQSLKVKSFADGAKQFIGQKVAMICARYQYRGTLSEVLEDCIILSNPTSVEVSGPSNAARPQTEDAIPCSIMIRIDAIELFYQPTWANAPLPGEPGYGST